MAQPNEIFIDRFSPALSTDRRHFFSELGEYCRFIWEELKPFPGRGYAVARMVVAAVVTVIVSETLRIPDPDFSAYLVFFIANEDGVSSAKLGLAAMAGLTVALVAAIAVTICFMDAPWFRLPATFLLIAGAVWLSRALTLAVLGRMMAVIFALYLSLADVTFDPEALTEATLWLWSVVGVAVGVTVLTNLVLEPRPDLLLRAQIVSSLDSIQALLESIASGRIERVSQAKAIRRQVYGTPQRLKQLLARWRQRQWPAHQHDVDWELAIFIVERLLSASAALAESDTAATDKRTSLVLAQLARTLGELKLAVQDRDREAIRSLSLPSTEDLPASVEKALIDELVAALSDSRLVFVPVTENREAPPAEKAAQPKRSFLIPDALTNPEYAQFAIKTTLAVITCEVFLNAVNWPGIRTCMITCVVTALATVGAQRQKQLLRLTGTTVGGLMGLVAIIYLVPQLNSIVGLALLVAGGAAVCAWVAAGSVRSSYAGFQMALAFFIMLLPGFDTSIDLTAIRDRFAGILVGITAMWIFFDLLWNTSSRRRAVDQLVEILRLMAKAPKVVSPALAPAEAREQASLFRRELYGELDAGRVFLDETKIELTLTLAPEEIRGNHLEIMAAQVSFTAFLLLALNEMKVRTLALGRLGRIQPLLQPVDAALTESLNRLASAFYEFNHSSSPSPTLPTVAPDLPRTPSDLALPSESDGVGHDLSSTYQALQSSVEKLSNLDWMVQALRSKELNR